jgi:cytochrome b561
MQPCRHFAHPNRAHHHVPRRLPPSRPPMEHRLKRLLYMLIFLAAMLVLIAGWEGA